MKNLTQDEQQTLLEIEQHIKIDALAGQLQTVLNTKDPIGYMEGKINWEVDNNLEKDEEKSFTKMIDNMANATISQKGIGFRGWHPFAGFISWFKRHINARKIKNALCKIANEIQELIDAHATLVTILQKALIAVVGVLGVASLINPVVATIVVGIIATMIIDGVNNVCTLA